MQKVSIAMIGWKAAAWKDEAQATCEPGGLAVCPPQTQRVPQCNAVCEVNVKLGHIFGDQPTTWRVTNIPGNSLYRLFSCRSVTIATHVPVAEAIAFGESNRIEHRGDCANSLWDLRLDRSPSRPVRLHTHHRGPGRLWLRLGNGPKPASCGSNPPV